METAERVRQARTEARSAVLGGVEMEEEETGSELVVEMHGELMRKRGSEKLHTDFLFRFKASLSVFKFIFILQSEDKTTQKQKQDLHTHKLSNTHTI